MMECGSHHLEPSRITFKFRPHDTGGAMNFLINSPQGHDAATNAEAKGKCYGFRFLCNTDRKNKGVSLLRGS